MEREMERESWRGRVERKVRKEKFRETTFHKETCYEI